ncbi:hypothetical protein E3P89_01822 [Wallemia ichthyophaga]|uniref:SWI/SNF and RSC complexes subunit ssr2 n=2 Tax=Wallemia ichthyophaga TaxID=245174 RepID=A0A4T0J9J2_WALIC|nr:SWI/SNF and RSC complexes subunit ssr2 [Wallemia ichthyophaga EXF-994]TIB02302.1 hypothetical protein E3P95_00901 [Wallemia ichthyophaga]EOR04766.1 SWI/SNF and RSC complexes subunit ssr2 [Wallemia ichthyophaga EXF-994]TIB03184.1 hypothetical protein E3P94_01033 [Wallemia ichthyophaga]TIB15350.1 hypothetical protein E3P90_00821 [Wallemia ichthyophaga]TIB17267.1 hypothetical protein E3P93_00678 [Wallemia ichthyophaga]
MSETNGVSPVDPANGKKHEAYPVVGGEISNISQNPDDNVSDDVKMENADENAIAREQYKYHSQEEAQKYLAAQTQEVIIPSYSSWFKFGQINAIEKRSLPEFFNNRNRSKTPTIYKEYRDFIINTYRLNPSEYLTFTACRRNLAGDVCAIMRVHAFLEQWGLINYQIDPDTRPAALGPPFTGHFRVTLDTPRGLQPLHPGTQPATKTAAKTEPAQVPQQSSQPPNVELRKGIYNTSSYKATEDPDETAKTANKFKTQNDDGVSGEVRYFCDVTGTECTQERYHSIKNPDYVLCPQAYLDGRFPTSMFSGDFIRITNHKYKHGTGGEEDGDGNGEPWTDEETLLLLEGLEQYDDDWNSVAEHVGTRSRESCIAQFLQLPIEDPYLVASSNTNTNTHRDAQFQGMASQGDLGPLAYGKFPFSQADNPVMSVVAFLASVVNPSVASAAAKASVGELSKSKSENQNQNANVNGSEEKMDVEPSRTSVEKAASVALGAAAAKAKTLSTDEEHNIEKFISKLVESQLKKLECKTEQFEQLELTLEEEKKSLENARMQLAQERTEFAKKVKELQKAKNDPSHTLELSDGQLKFENVMADPSEFAGGDIATLG